MISGPNSINFDVLNNFDELLDQNPVCFAIVITLLCLWVLVLVFFKVQDRRDMKKWVPAPLLDNKFNHFCKYKITVYTGFRLWGGTSANISIQLFGKWANSDIHILKSDMHKSFPAYSTVSFVMATKKVLGPLIQIKVTSDNTGRRPAWYLYKIEVKDLSKYHVGKACYTFMFDNWLSKNSMSGLDATIKAAVQEDLTQPTVLLQESLRNKFSEHHKGFSLCVPPYGTTFSRSQRWSCFIMTFFLVMLVSAMWYQTSEERRIMVSLGLISVSVQQIFVSFVCVCMVFPPTTLVVQLFRHIDYGNSRRLEKNMISQKPFDNYNIESKQSIADALEETNEYKSKRGWSNKGYTKEQISYLLELYCMVALLQRHITSNNPTIFNHRDETYEDEYDVLINDLLRDKESHADEEYQPYKNPSRCKINFYFLYLGWFICIASIFSCAFFIILYSLDWGADKSNEWLGVFFLSFFQDLFLIDPIIVILFGAIGALLLHRKRINERSAFLDDELFHDMEDVLDNNHAELKAKQEHHGMMMNKAKSVFKELIVQVILIWIVISLSYVAKDKHSYNFYQSIKNQFVDSFYEEVSNRQNYFSWMQNSFFLNFFSSYDDVRISDELNKYTSDQNSYRVGYARLRQLRVKEGPCPSFDFPTMFYPHSRPCYPSYSNEMEDKATFGEGMLNNSREQENLNAWIYKSPESSEDFVYMGKLHFYEAGGYIANLNESIDDSMRLVQDLERQGWLDRQTRAVFLEFTLFNTNINLFATITLLAEVVPQGGVVQFHSVNVIRAFSLSSSGLYFALCALIFIGLFIGFIVFECCMVITQGCRKYCKRFMTYYNNLIILLSGVMIGMFIYNQLELSKVMEHLNSSKDYTDFRWLATLDETIKACLAIVNALAICKLVYLLRLYWRISIFISTLKFSSNSLMPFLILFVCYVFGLAWLAQVCFGPYLYAYRTLINSIYMILSMQKPFFIQYYEVNAVYSWLYLILLVAGFMFVLVNILISVLMGAHAIVVADDSKQLQDYQLVSFIKEYVDDRTFSAFKKYNNAEDG